MGILFSRIAIILLHRLFIALICIIALSARAGINTDILLPYSLSNELSEPGLPGLSGNLDAFSDFYEPDLPTTVLPSQSHISNPLQLSLSKRFSSFKEWFFQKLQQELLAGHLNLALAIRQAPGKQVPDGQQVSGEKAVNKNEGNYQKKKLQAKNGRQLSNPSSDESSDDDDPSDSEDQQHTYNNQCPLCQNLPCRRKKNADTPEVEHPSDCDHAGACGCSHAGGGEEDLTAQSNFENLDLLELIVVNAIHNHQGLFNAQRLGELHALLQELHAPDNAVFLQNLSRLLPQGFADELLLEDQLCEHSLQEWGNLLLEATLWARAIPESGFLNVQQSYGGVGFTNYLSAIFEMACTIVPERRPREGPREKRAAFRTKIFELSANLEAFWLAGHKLLTEGDFDQLMALVNKKYRPHFPRARPSEIQWLFESGGQFNPFSLWDVGETILETDINTDFDSVSAILESIMEPGFYHLTIELTSITAIIEVKENNGKKSYTLFSSTSGTAVAFSSLGKLVELLRNIKKGLTVTRLKLTENLIEHNLQIHNVSNIMDALNVLELEIDPDDYFNRHVPFDELVVRQLTREMIKKRYGELARIYHPDKQKDKKGNSDKFIEIQKAYKLLTDLFQNSEAN